MAPSKPPDAFWLASGGLLPRVVPESPMRSFASARIASIVLAFAFLLATTAVAADGNRLAYLSENDPFYVSRSFPKLVTPQWLGEQGVEAVVILAIDDLKEDKPGEHERW